MKFKILIFYFFFHSFSGFAQSISMPEFNLNKSIPGAAYAFSFVHITDVHVGEDYNQNGNDYGGNGFDNDTVPYSDNSQPVRALKNAVTWINANAALKNIKFVIVSGDLTGSAEKSEMLHCRDILNKLQIPYVPIIGNHDIWPYVRYNYEARYAYGDSVWNEVFDSVFTANKLFFENWDDGTRLSRTYDPEDSLEHYFQNFSFEYDDFVFYGLDFNPRYHVHKAEPGIGPEAQLMDWNGGTFSWLKQELASNTHLGNENTILIAHHPITDNLIMFASGFVFERNEYDKMVAMLAPYKNSLALWLSGHIHFDTDYYLSNILRVRTMAANKDFEQSRFEVVNVYQTQQVTTVKENKNSELLCYPNPNNGIFNLELNNIDKDAILIITDLSGKIVLTETLNRYLQQNNYHFDFSTLPKGKYLLNITNKNTFPETIKFVIQ